ncbi:MAG: metallophosphoesterase [Gammaproteobacteria bacterium]|nr:metallophosphoesterase [Gammaproteobacteria bacterium]
MQALNRVFYIIYVALFGFIFTSTHVLAATPTQGKSALHFLTMTDLHFDPFTSCGKQIPCPLIQKMQATPAQQWATLLTALDKNPPRYLADSNFNLLHSTFIEASKVAELEQAQFIILLGDYLGHDLRTYYKKYSLDRSLVGYQSFIKKMMTFLTLQLREAFPGKDIYPVIGNNDSYQGDYFQEINGSFFRDLANLWGPLIQNQNERGQFNQTFLKGGYYAINAHGDPRLRIIALNTVLFSSSARGKQVLSAAEEELNWLRNELKHVKTNHQKALILMHIPPGIDVFATLRFRLFTLIEFWQKKNAKAFQALLKENAEDIVGIFAGHLHSDWFQILTFPHSEFEIPLCGNPAVSPIFGNNPAFRSYQYSLDQQQLENYITYYYSIRQKGFWKKEYDFNATYNPNCKDCKILTGMKSFERTDQYEIIYKNYYSVGERVQPIVNKFKPYYACARRYLDASEYLACLKLMKPLSGA